MKYENKDIVYIEYQENKPFSVIIADENGYLEHYDFEQDCNNNQRLKSENKT